MDGLELLLMKLFVWIMRCCALFGRLTIFDISTQRFSGCIYRTDDRIDRILVDERMPYSEIERKSLYKKVSIVK